MTPYLLSKAAFTLPRHPDFPQGDDSEGSLLEQQFACDDGVGESFVKDSQEDKKRVILSLLISLH